MARFTYGRSNIVDPALAGFAGAALAFAAFAMPEWRLTQIVAATGLPDILAAAQPPLGMKARLGFALVVGLFSFGAFFAVLRRLDGGARVDGGADSIDADRAPEPIRLRRADFHPDAPARRPLVAGREFGEPPPEEELLLEPEQADAAASLPPFLVAQEAEEAEEVAVEPVDDPVAQAQDQEVPFAFPSVVQAEPAIPLAAPEPAASPEPEPVAERAPEPEPQPEPEARPEPECEGEESISRLMKRLEFGLARRERAAPADPAAIAPRADDAVGHRLRSAITDLEKLAARG